MAVKQNEAEPVEVGARVRELRQKKGWTLDQLAGEVGVSKGSLSLLENGKARPAGLVMLRIANALDASVDYLLRGSAALPKECEKTSVEIPAELAELALEQGWSARRTFALVRAREALLARRSDRPRRSFTRTEWMDFAERLAPFLENEEG